MNIPDNTAQDRQAGDSDFGETLNRVLSDPEAMASIMKLASNFKKEEKPSDAQGAAETSSSPPARKEDSPSADSAKQASKHPDNEDRIRLLSALKPYLGESRREKTDYMIKILSLLKTVELSSLLSGLQGRK